MPRVDELLAWLGGRPLACEACGSPVVAIAGPGGVRVVVCPTCDVTSGAVEPPAELHARVHPVEDLGCPDCVAWRRARI